MSMTLEMPLIFEQLIKLQQQQPDFVNKIVTPLLQLDKKLWRALVINMYQDGKINLGKAAELLELHELELRDQFIKLGIPLRLGPATLEEAWAEVQAIETWFVSEAVP